MQHGLHGANNGGQDGDSKEGIEASIDHWLSRLAGYRANIPQEPMSNPIRRVAFDISRDLEAGKISQEHIDRLAKELCDRAVIRRAERMRGYVGELDIARRTSEVEDLVRASTIENGEVISFEAFEKKWSAARQGIVFTAHPTFVMSEELRSIYVDVIARGDEAKADARRALETVSHGPDKHISLIAEHSQVQSAIQNAKIAIGHVNRAITKVAREVYPDQWTSLTPCPVVINCWVGYDLDGRTDIRWSDSFRFRLQEKNQQLKSHLDGIAITKADPALALNSDVGKTLDALASDIQTEQKRVDQYVMLFGQDLSVPERLSQTANTLTDGQRTALSLSMKEACDRVDQLINRVEGDDAKAALLRLKTRFSNHGLGTAKIHVRINAMQLHNAVRNTVGAETLGNLSSRTLIRRMDEMIRDVHRVDVNFASLSVESTTAVKQFINAAQILKYIDRDAPIRLLIAECEHSFTVMAALYYARLFGVEDKLDISPLFETEEAMEKGARIIETLLKSEQYREQVRRRGRLCIETGFSDAGRFIGQIPAALAIERLHGKLADVMVQAGMTDVELLIYDTHGESMGRGTHPGSLEDRFAYNLSPWVRQRYIDRNIDLHHEVSFQGGDGYALFGKPEIAMAVVTELLKSAIVDEESCKSDQFYIDSDFSHDYFEHIKSYQARLFHDENYGEFLGSFGTNVLSKSGSRKSKRQFDAGGDNRAAPAEMRAIPHNALLQQFGYVLNVVSGIGAALKYRQERFAEMHNSSDRIQRIIKMVAKAKQLSSIKTLVAYASMFDDAYWVTRPLNDLEPHLKEPCLLLADVLRDDRRHESMMHLATYLRDDAVYLHDLLRAIGTDLDLERLDGREELDLLHALRIAMIQHIYLLAARVPAISTRNDVSFRRIVSYVLGLHVDEAVAFLRDAFPKDQHNYASFDMTERATYSYEDATHYEEINDQLIDPLVAAYKTVLGIGVGISHHFGAHG